MLSFTLVVLVLLQSPTQRGQPSQDPSHHPACPARPTLSCSSRPVLLVLSCPARPVLSWPACPVLLGLSCPVRRPVPESRVSSCTEVFRSIDARMRGGSRPVKSPNRNRALSQGAIELDKSYFNRLGLVSAPRLELDF
jgi:hypothetical protein